MGDELMKSTTPGEELVAGALRDRGVDLDAHLTETVDNRLAIDEVVGTPVHVHVVNLLVEVVGIGEDTIIGGLHVETEDGAAEGAEPSELVEVLKNDIEGLVTTP